MTIIITTVIVFAIWLALAIHGAKDFESTGYPQECFDCNRTDCIGCKFDDGTHRF